MKWLGSRLFFMVLFVVISWVTAQETGVTAEAINQANVRADDDINATLVAEIRLGTVYSVIGRSEFFPWLLIGDPQTGEPIGWVYETLLNIRGNVANVPVSNLVISNNPPTPTLASQPNTNATPTATLVTNVQQATPTPTANSAFAVTGVIQGEINIRYGPGLEYPRIGVGLNGERFGIIAYHSQFPWVKIDLPDAPNGEGWVAIDLLQIEGNVFSLPAISQVRFDLPTLTPTPPVVRPSSLDESVSSPLSPRFQFLGDQIWDIILQAGFDPETSRFGSFFLLDLQTGEALTIGEQYAFSGMSVSKIAILASLYGAIQTPPTEQLATDIANTMICSENVATNRLLSLIGAGDEYMGAENVTRFVNDMGLENTFITAPFTTDPDNPPVPPRPIPIPETSADQIKANPDLSNQMTVEDLGWLMGGIYQCAYQDGGLLMESYPEQYDGRECRQMLHVMSNNTVDALLKAGVPANTRVAHKHGWIEDTHGNAATFFTPGGDYVIVMTLFQPTWLNFQESLPVIAEVSRTVYNFYNPENPMPAIRDGFIPEAGTCNFAGTPLVADLMRVIWDE